MKLDDLDTDILVALHKISKGTTTDLAHELFAPQDRHNLKKADSKIRYHTEKLRKAHLLEKNGTQYRLNNKRVSLTQAKLQLAIGAQVPMGMMLVVIPLEGEVMMRQVEFMDNSQKKSS